MDFILYNYFNSPIGEIELAEFEGNLVEVAFVETKNKVREKKPITDSDLFRETKLQLDAYFNRSFREFDLPLNGQGTLFQKKVWLHLQTIAFSKTISYLDFSKQLGNVKAIRAVASANGKNPFAIIIPCHRVIGSDGSLTGYAGDLWRKKWLLEHEAIHTKQINLFE